MATVGVEVLLDLLAGFRPGWHADALCQEYPEVNFFPPRGEHPRPALAVCSRCLALEECRAWALDQGGALPGVWAA